MRRRWISRSYSATTDARLDFPELMPAEVIQTYADRRRMLAPCEAFFVGSRSAEDVCASTRAKRDDEPAEKDRSRCRKSRKSMKRRDDAGR